MYEALLDIMLMWGALCLHGLFSPPALSLLSGFCFQEHFAVCESIQSKQQIKSSSFYHFTQSSVCLVLPGHHSILRPREIIRPAASHDRKRPVSQVPFPQTALPVWAQYGVSAGHTDQRLRPRPGGDPHRRQEPSRPQHPLFQHSRWVKASTVQVTAQWDNKSFSKSPAVCF